MGGVGNWLTLELGGVGVLPPRDVEDREEVMEPKWEAEALEIECF